MEQPALTKTHVEPLHGFDRWFILGACALVLLTEQSRYLTAFTVGEYIFAPKALVSVSGLILLAWAWIHTRTAAARSQNPGWKLLLVPVALIGWTLLSTLWADYPDRTPVALEWITGFSLVMLIGIAARPIWGSRWTATAPVAMVLVIVAIGLVEKITDTHLPLSNLHNPYRQQWAITSVFIGQNHLAASLALLLPLVAGFGLAWHGWRRWASMVTVAGGMVALFFTGSTLGLAAVGVAAMVFWICAVARAKSKMRGRLFFIALLGMLGLVAVWTFTPASVKERVSVASVGVRQSFEARRALIKEGIELLKQQPVRGLGPGATNAQVEVTVGNQPTLHALHNLTLEFVVTFGVLAGLAVAAWLLVVIVRLLRRLRGKGQRWPTIGILASMAALSIVQAVPSTFEGVRAPFIVLGFALALAMRPNLVGGRRVSAH